MGRSGYYYQSIFAYCSDQSNPNKNNQTNLVSYHLQLKKSYERILNPNHFLNTKQPQNYNQ